MANRPVSNSWVGQYVYEQKTKGVFHIQKCLQGNCGQMTWRLSKERDGRGNDVTGLGQAVEVRDHTFQGMINNGTYKIDPHPPTTAQKRVPYSVRVANTEDGGVNMFEGMA